MAGIFLSYRRSDAEGQAGRLYDDLAGHFGADAVFMDVAGIEAGRDFRQAIDQHVTSCGVLLAIIGKEWVTATDANGRRRLDDANDFVRLEVAAALKRGIPVVPVLVRGAAMPQAAELPADCADLCYRNAMELTHARWNSDVQVLIKALGRYVSAGASPAAQKTDTPESNKGVPSPTAITQSRGARPWLIAIPIVMAVVGGGVVAYRSQDKNDTTSAAPSQSADPQRGAGEGLKPADPAMQLPADRAADKQSPQTLIAADAPDNQAQRKSSEPGGTVDSAKPTAAGGIPLSEWMPTSQFQSYRLARPPTERFPYDIELQCIKKGDNKIRARFGPQPRGVQEFRISHSLFHGEPKLPAVEGFREYATAQCRMPTGGRLIMRVMVRP